MHIRFLTASAMTLLLASPAFADCQEEITNLDQAVIAAETGAHTGDGSLPATEHQEQALSEEGAEDETPDAGSVTGSVEAASPHQLEVLREAPEETRTQASTILSEARDMASAGDEQGCMDKLQEAKGLLGLEE